MGCDPFLLLALADIILGVIDSSIFESFSLSHVSNVFLLPFFKTLFGSLSRSYHSNRWNFSMLLQLTLYLLGICTQREACWCQVGGAGLEWVAELPA